MTRRVLVVAMLSLAVASPAEAQSSGATSAAARAAAQESYAKGIRFFNQAEQKHDPALYDSAYDQFLEAFANYPDDRILWNLGVTEIKSGRFVGGLTHLRAYDKHQHVIAQPNHPDRVMLSALLEQGNRATGHLVVEAPEGTLLGLDGKPIGKAPLADTLDVEPGTHELTASFRDGKTLRLEPSSGAGEVKRVSVSEAPPDPFPATPKTPALVPPVAGPPKPIETRSAATASGSSVTARGVLAVSMGVVALGGIAAGVVFEVAAGNSQSLADQLGAQIPSASNACGAGTRLVQCQQLKDANQSTQNDKNMAAAFFVTGGVAAAAALGILLLWPSASLSDSVQLVPAISPTLAGVQFRGAF